MVRPRVALVRLALALAVAPAAIPEASAQNALGRDDEPIVLVGADTGALLGADPATVVAFRRQAGAWTRIPVQVDERVSTDFATIYGEPDPASFPYPGLSATLTTYADPGTYVGADPDPGVDADDEIVFLAGQAGSERAAAGAHPPGTLADRSVEVDLTHPGSGAVAYAYLFVSDGSLPAFPAVPDVRYDFVLSAGSYPADYDVQSGPNPEDSTVVTPAYSVHFADRWIRDATAVSAGGAPGIDLLDRHKSLFAPGDCRRSEDTFSAGEGAFIVNRAGPVRALRGYVGANSGPTSHRIHAFYARREEIRVFLRVHPIDGIVDYFDYAPAAAGMSYRNDRNPAGVTVDGVPDAPVPGLAAWEMVTGAQGTIAHVTRVETDIPDFLDADVTSYYSDDATPATVQCTGDAFEYGASGLRVRKRIPNTDPANGAAYRFEAIRTIAFGAPSASNDFAVALADSVDAPLVVGARSSGGGSSTECPDSDGDGWVECVGSCVVPAGATCGECDDADASIRPGATERCDGRDDDCDLAVDDVQCADYDWDGDGRVDGAELVVLGRAFGACGSAPGSGWRDRADLDGDGCVDGDDLAVFATVFGRACAGAAIACD